MSHQPSVAAQKKSWNKNVVKVVKKMTKVYEEVRLEIVKGDVSPKSFTKLTQQLEKTTPVIDQSPYKSNEVIPDDVSQTLITLLDAIIDFLLKIEHEDSTHTQGIYVMLLKLIEFPNYQPYLYEDFPPPQISTSLSNVFCSYYNALLRTALLLISSMTAAPILNSVKEQKEKLKVKKLTTYQFVMKAPPLEEKMYQVTADVLAAVSLRIPQIAKEIFEAISSKPVNFCRSIYPISVWESFSKYCVATNRMCQKFQSGLSGVENKWTLHFSARLPFSFKYYIAYLNKVIAIVGTTSEQITAVHGYVQLVSFTTHLSHGKPSKLNSPEMFYTTIATLCLTQFPSTFKKVMEDKFARTNAYSIDSLSNFVVSSQKIFETFVERGVVLGDVVDTERIVKVLDAIMKSDSYYALSTAMSLLYELLGCLDKVQKKVIQQFIVNNFNFFAIHWYYQTRRFFFKVIFNRLTIAPAFRITGSLLENEVKKYEKYGDLTYETTLTEIIQLKIKFLRAALKGDKKLQPEDLPHKKYLKEAVDEIDEELKEFEKWKTTNTEQCPLQHLDLTLVTKLENSLI
ncbi:hypothetical protein EIN_359800 [Entamoeba invadens IP1]|uniref:Uncharacterized protein n=1 Tax=Entamoeba invadens IP1 TaxID=370355 RepID=A0A0A1U7Q9_ENTIV|nr:hypothetical protein EIN_359800 [Entamoeba invadens IP1]ELP90887.1 hypothetical protein EIN_359800 [Entamoeba invadens IP1]|eukprot:XP_004257658.1 hypothetical protein EIN_359800 [Entamoeba invadens IP1]